AAGGVPWGVAWLPVPGLVGAWLGRTVKAGAVVPLLPWVTEASATATVGSGSSLTMVPTACDRPRVPLVVVPRLRYSVSSGSYSVSPTTGTVAVRDVWPGLNHR